MRMLSISAVVLAAATFFNASNASAQTSENVLREEYEQKSC